METKTIRNFILGLVLGGVLVAFALRGAVVEKPITKPLEVVDEESVVTKVVEEATPSVVTVSISKTNIINNNLFPGFDIFGDFFGMQIPKQQQQEQKIEQDIGTGFVISNDGLIVTNKHVVSDTTAKYKVVIGKDEVVEVKEIYRDPENDLAILRVDKKGLTPVKLGDSDKLKVGQTVIAIGTALGEFRSTVTKGVISGLGRGITAGNPFEGSEKLENVIQTDAAINPGNSGGPLFNSAGEVIGVNVAVSQGAQSIGFALPINLIRDSINNFKTTGGFERPYLGVSYQMITKQAALLNEVPAGAYVQALTDNGPAAKAGVKVGDIITEIDGVKLVDNKDISIVSLINKKKIGDEVTIKLWRDKSEVNLRARLEKRV
ncbi:MAG: trypsin-like peptidase domain-containing protein [Candidatus Shapirobacteria bacterium]|jgi:S1-C subfamily serine protease